MRSWVLPSVKVPIAVNCCVPPKAIETLPGLTAIETRAGAPTASDAPPEICPTEAEMLVVPWPALVAKPGVPGLLPTIATVTEDEFHITVPVKSWVLPSLYVPAAVNCCVVPSEIEADSGLTAMETKIAGVTVNVAVPLTVPEVPLIVVVPTVKAVASPCDPKASLIVATLAGKELQYADWVRSCVLPSVKVPVAANCWLVPAAIEGSNGVMAIETSVAGVTVSSVEPTTDPDIALTLAVPTPTLLASPVLLIVAVETVSDDHVAVIVRFCVLPSLYVPVAVNCCVTPSAMEGVTGVTAIETRVAATTVSTVDPVTLPDVALIVAVPELTPVARPCEPV